MPGVERTDIAIIGGGFYGAYAADQIKVVRPDLDVTIVEREPQPFTRASSTNQGQFHMGYMYSNDPNLAAECVENIDRFRVDFGEAVDEATDSYFAIHRESEIDPEGFEAFCELMGLQAMRQQLADRRDLAGPDIAALYRTNEKTFNSARLQEVLRRKLGSHGVKLVRNFSALSVGATADSGIEVVADDGRILQAEQVLNVTFADINALHERSGLPRIPMQSDSFLHFVLGLPEQYRDTALTVIRGPYASLLPSSFRGGHILAHAGLRKIESSRKETTAEQVAPEVVQGVYRQAMADAQRYMPLLREHTYLGHTLGVRVAHIDPDTGNYTSRALVFEDFGNLDNYHVVLGGKVSCMADIAEDIQKIVTH